MKVNIRTPKTCIYNFYEGKKNKFQREDKETDEQTQDCFSRVKSAHVSLELKKYANFTELAVDSKTKIVLHRYK